MKDIVTFKLNASYHCFSRTDEVRNERTNDNLATYLGSNIVSMFPVSQKLLIF